MVTPRRAAYILAVMFGVVFGVGFFTFDYAEGTSYFSTDPKACANCHIMNDEYSSWHKAGHHQAATCVDCHLPHDFIPKYIAKADHGYRHSKAFTLQNFKEPIEITPRDQVIVQQNCVRCHSDVVHELVEGSRAPSGEAVQCVHCHAGVGHGVRW